MMFIVIAKAVEEIALHEDKQHSDSGSPHSDGSDKKSDQYHPSNPKHASSKLEQPAWKQVAQHGQSKMWSMQILQLQRPGKSHSSYKRQQVCYRGV